jgi:3-hydroxybutyryl-CoA dehydrogenase
MIKTIGVCGAGTMGSGIAQVSAMAGYPTILYDMDPGMIAKAKAAIAKRLSTHQAALDHIIFTTELTACLADLIIEAIVEVPAAKLDLFTKLAAVNNPDTILASNTSSLSLDALAKQIPRPERFAGLHFFNPAPLMKLVEVVQTKYSAPATTSTLLELARQMGKTPVLCTDSPGFIVNHVARPYYLEALRLVEQGHADVETIDALMEAAGFKMGPFRLLDLIGNALNSAVSESVYDALGRPERLKPSPIQHHKVQAGELGRKTGKGYYRYD